MARTPRGDRVAFRGCGWRSRAGHGVGGGMPLSYHILKSRQVTCRLGECPRSSPARDDVGGAWVL
jgi:hypothetical protein